MKEGPNISLEEKVHEVREGQTMIKEVRGRMEIQANQVPEEVELVESEDLEEEEESMSSRVIGVELKATKHMNVQTSQLPVKEAMLGRR